MTTPSTPAPSAETACSPSYFFVFDVESIGLHGEAFAVAGGIYLANGAAQSEFCFACNPGMALGDDDDRKWVMANVPMLEETHRSPTPVRQAFWNQWMQAKRRYPNIRMAAECLWPVEAKFVADCIADSPLKRKWEGPYPFVDISAVMLGAGMDPMATYERTPSEMPPHNPLADTRQSVRLLARALSVVNADSATNR